MAATAMRPASASAAIRTGIPGRRAEGERARRSHAAQDHRVEEGSKTKRPRHSRAQA